MPRRSGPDFFRVLADLEGLGIAVRELIDSGLELRALAVFVAADRAAHAIKLDRQHRVTQRFPADVGHAVRIGLRHLFDRLEGELGAVIRVGVIARYRSFAVVLPVRRLSSTPVFISLFCDPVACHKGSFESTPSG